MEIKHYQSIIEAELFSSGEPVELTRLAEAIEIDTDTAERLTEALMHETNARPGGIRIVRLGRCYQMCTRLEYAPYIRKALDIRRNMPLSQAAMEVLSIIAYNQPVTRAYIEQVRGVECDTVIQGLVAKNLVEEKGRLDLPGRPLIYGTTADFLRCFGLSSLDELPSIPQPGGEEMEETSIDGIIESSSAEGAEESPVETAVGATMK